MADKFPDLGLNNDSPENVDELGSDFLAREKELIGDEFQTEQDKDALADEDNEINDFKSNFPDLDNQPSASKAEESSGDEFEGFGSSAPTKELDSTNVDEWKQRRDLEISEREKANSKKKEEIVSKAQQTIDDFYDNYNTKKEAHAKEILTEQEKFVEDRDGFLKRGTLWGRVNELVDEVGAAPSDNNRDKSRFTELLQKLKDKENAPGAAGY